MISILAMEMLGSFILSLLFSKYFYDPLHWGLMMSNAIDLIGGKLPYKEIFIQYGILTTLLQGLGLILFGKKVYVIGMVTALFFGFSLLLLYKIWSHFLPFWLSLILVVIFWALSPYIRYPWSNYFSTLFLFIAIWLQIQFFYRPASRKRNQGLFFLGFFYALAILARETVIVIVVPYWLIFILADALAARNKQTSFNISSYAKISLGFLVPLIPFGIYLISQGIVSNWYLHSLPIWGGYVETHIQNVGVLGKIIQIFSFSTTNPNHTWNPWISFLLSPLLYLNIALLIYIAYQVFFKRQSFSKHAPAFICALHALLGVSAILHYQDPFRVQLSNLIGLAGIFYLGQEFLKTRPAWLQNSIRFILVSGLLITVYGPFVENMQLLVHRLKAETINPVTVHPFLTEQKFDQSTITRYEELKVLFNKAMRFSRCDILYLENQTQDVFLNFITPLQIAHHASSFDHNTEILNRIVDPANSEKVKQLEKNGNLVIYQYTNAQIPKNYFIYDIYQDARVLLPNICFGSHSKPDIYSNLIQRLNQINGLQKVIFSYELGLIEQDLTPLKIPFEEKPMHEIAQCFTAFPGTIEQARVVSVLPVKLNTINAVYSPELSKRIGEVKEDKAHQIDRIAAKPDTGLGFDLLILPVPKATSCRHEGIFPPSKLTLTVPYDDHFGEIRMVSNGSISLPLYQLLKGKYTFRFKGRGTPAGGIKAKIQVNIIHINTAKQIYGSEIDLDEGAQTFPIDFEIDKNGVYQIRITYLNDAIIDGQDRNAFIKDLSLKSLP